MHCRLYKLKIGLPFLDESAQQCVALLNFGKRIFLLFEYFFSLLQLQNSVISSIGHLDWIYCHFKLLSGLYTPSQLLSLPTQITLRCQDSIPRFFTHFNILAQLLNCRFQLLSLVKLFISFLFLFVCDFGILHLLKLHLDQFFVFFVQLLCIVREAFFFLCELGDFSGVTRLHEMLELDEVEHLLKDCLPLQWVLLRIHQ